MMVQIPITVIIISKTEERCKITRFVLLFLAGTHVLEIESMAGHKVEITQFNS
jgi:hypothetical protein